MSDILSRIANSIPIRWGYFTKNNQAQKVIFVGHEKAIYGDDNVRLDVKLHNIKDNISDAFLEDKVYAVGDYCIYLNSLYKFIATKAAGAWDGSKVVPVSVSGELAALNTKTSNTDKIVHPISGTYNEATAPYNTIVAFRTGGLITILSLIEDSTIEAHAARQYHSNGVNVRERFLHPGEHFHRGFPGGCRVWKQDGTFYTNAIANWQYNADNNYLDLALNFSGFVRIECAYYITVM